MAHLASSCLVAGAGGHGRVVADLLRLLGHDVVGYADDDTSKLGAVIDPTGAQVITTLRSLLDRLANENELPGGAERVALGIGDNARRLSLFAALQPLCLQAVVHPSAAVSETAFIEDGSVVLAHATINTGARLGSAVIVNSGAIVEHDCILDDGVHVSPGATICGSVSVGARTWIGAGATVIHCLSIGSDAVVGAGAVVVGAVPDAVVVVGNPARMQARSSPNNVDTPEYRSPAQG